MFIHVNNAYEQTHKHKQQPNKQANVYAYSKPARPR